MQQENANMLRAQLSWRSVEVSCEFSNDLGVATGRAFGEVAQPEILLHALARMPSRMRASSVSTFVLWMMRPYLEAQMEASSSMASAVDGGLPGRMAGRRLPVMRFSVKQLFINFSAGRRARRRS
jgi:hypothetical protein